MAGVLVDLEALCTACLASAVKTVIAADTCILSTELPATRHTPSCWPLATGC
jgi:hypothetical protein